MGPSSWPGQQAPQRIGEYALSTSLAYISFIVMTLRTHMLLLADQGRLQGRRDRAAVLCDCRERHRVDLHHLCRVAHVLLEGDTQAVCVCRSLSAVLELAARGF